MVLQWQGRTVTFNEGEVVTIGRGERHAFSVSGDRGLIVEEVSTADIPGDSYYTDPLINENKARKTPIQYCPEW
jgi:D-lyxose ketol-isomerase